MTRTPQRFTVDSLPVEVHPDPRSLGVAAATAAAETLRRAIAHHGRARAIFATGNSQLDFFRALREQPGVAWSQVEAFHMDEYLGITADHPASFRGFLQQHLLTPLGIGTFFGISGAREHADATIRTYLAALRSAPIDLVCMGIGENGHLAFNDPPLARFDDPEGMRVVELDRQSRLQQVGEGHFPNLEAVPTHALTLTIPTLLAPPRQLVIVPEGRKAAAVTRALEGPIDPACPASILRQVPHATLYLDPGSAHTCRFGDRTGA